MDQPYLSVSIVVLNPDVDALVATLETLHQAVLKTGWPTTLWLIDNGIDDKGHEFATHFEFRQALALFSDRHIITGHGNVGFGRGHDLAISRTSSRYHLVLNPDVELGEESLVNAIAWLEARPEFGLLTPRTVSPDGHLQYLCRRYPTLCVLFLRGFAPATVRHLLRARLSRYEMRPEIDAESVVLDPPIVSGCFMFCRTSELVGSNGFDPHFFLYFEDYDLSLRLARRTRLAYVPEVRIMHRGGDAARKGARHVMMFMRSAIRFFNLHGWRLC